LITAMSVIHG